MVECQAEWNNVQHGVGNIAVRGASAAVRGREAAIVVTVASVSVSFMVTLVQLVANRVVDAAS